MYEATGGADGFVSLEVSPTLADDTEGTIAEAKRLHGQAARPNVLIKVPGTKAGVVAIEELIVAGIPINVTLLFSREHYLAAADAYLKGLERRVQEGASPNVASVASLFISRWDAASAPKLPEELRNRLGIAIGQRTFKAYRDLLASERWQRLAAAGARPQRLLWASTSAKDPTLPDTYYVTALAAEDTVNTMPEATLLAFGRHGSVGALLSTDATDAEAVIAGVDEGRHRRRRAGRRAADQGARRVRAIRSPSCSRASRPRLPSCAKRAIAVEHLSPVAAVSPRTVKRGQQRIRQGNGDATRNDRPRPDGRQHGAASDAGRSRVRGVRSLRGRGEDVSPTRVRSAPRRWTTSSAS